jgi:hypothetical protein
MYQVRSLEIITCMLSEHGLYSDAGLSSSNISSSIRWTLEFSSALGPLHSLTEIGSELGTWIIYDRIVVISLH